MDRTSIIELICERLSNEKVKLRQDFQNSTCPTRYFILDNLLPLELVQRAYLNFPRPAEMRLMDSFREKKYTTKNLKKFNATLENITFAIQDPKVIKLIEDITGFNSLVGDEKLYAGGLSLMTKGHYLNPHIDNSHNDDQSLYRRANLLYYISPDWEDSYGGNLELWDSKVKNQTTILSKFNRLVFMETNSYSWHSVSPVLVNKSRCCISNYYFSQTSPNGQKYFHVTSFSARPDQSLLRMISKIDNMARSLVRMFKKDGIGLKDFYNKS